MSRFGGLVWFGWVGFWGIHTNPGNSREFLFLSSEHLCLVLRFFPFRFSFLSLGKMGFGSGQMVSSFTSGFFLLPFCITREN